MRAAAILTGGQARRFHGHDKSGLIVDSLDGRTILERQLTLLAPMVDDLLIVTSAARVDAFPTRRLILGARLVLDTRPGTGPLGAILTALDAALAPIFVLGGDMPWVPAALVHALAAEHARGGWDVTAPAGARGLEPLCAVYGGGVRPHLERALGDGDLAVHRAIRHARLGIVDAAMHGDSARMFRNLNAPEDLDPTR